MIALLSICEEMEHTNDTGMQLECIICEIYVHRNMGKDIIRINCIEVENGWEITGYEFWVLLETTKVSIFVKKISPGLRMRSR